MIANEFNVHGSLHRNNIPTYIQQDATLHSLFYLETALHVSGGTTTLSGGTTILLGGTTTLSCGTTTHHQERKQLYLQHLVFVTPLLLPAAVVEELEPV